MPFFSTVTLIAETKIHVTGAKLNGQINPNTSPNGILFEWWFTYGGNPNNLTNDTNGSAGTSTAHTSIASGQGLSDIGIVVTSLTADTSYSYRLWLKKTDGSIVTYYSSPSGALGTFTTAESTTIAFSSITSESVDTDSISIGYSVNTNGNHCSLALKYGTSSGSITNTYSTLTDVLTTSATAKTATIDGLNANTTYYWQVTATVDATSATTSSSADAEATEPNLPTVTTKEATNEANTSATINGRIDHTLCGTIDYYFQWGLTIDYGTNTTTIQITGTSGYTNVSVNLTNLITDDIYYYRLRATNDAGGAIGQPMTFVPTPVRYAMMNPSIHKVGYVFKGDVDATRRYRERNKPEFMPMFKSAVVLNRTTYLGHVKYTESDGSVHIHKDRILKSKPAKPDLFTKSGYLDVVVEDGDDIVKLEEFADNILQFKKNILYVIDSGGGRGESLKSGHPLMGIKNPAASIRTERGVIFINDMGCYVYDGKGIRNLLIDVKEDRYKIDLGVWANFINDNSQVGYVPQKNFIFVVDSAKSTTSSGNMYIFDMNTESWVYAYQKLDSNDKTNFIIDNNGNLIFAGNDTTGTFYCINGVEGATKSPYLETRDIDFKDPSIFKKLYKVYITYKGTLAEGPPSLSYSIDGLDSWSQAADGQFYDVGLDQWARGVFTLSESPVKCQSVKIRINDSNLTRRHNMAVNDIAIEYRLLKPQVTDTGASLA